MKKFIPLLMMLLLIPTFAQAQKREFDIEVLIFKRSIDPEKTAESWPNELQKIDFSSSQPFSNAHYRHKKGAQMLSYDHYKLLKERDVLKRHAGFEVLFHKAWRQVDHSKAYSPKFHIQAGKDFSKTFNADGSKISADHPASSKHAPVYELDGTIQVYVQHYLFAETQLNLHEPSVRSITFTEKSPDELKQSENFAVLADTESDNVQAGNLQQVSPKKVEETFLKSYRMDQKRRMRSGETHYLDNPLMGMIIQVRKVTH
ncbi:peptidoglycan binding protein CsiV [Vibrio rarus]|uniref:peptidoglycan binding protein CsiV n=1 Tax=Vibrio rarus TaxID=413403 RepID=UPI0021C3CB7C|nr:peptidoglycan binding protein CsiV [Vibrio rarus]